tara:strand:- start:451 stop:636 length:186 start_codon:yes stop_codon:yes gene_type:complete
MFDSISTFDYIYDRGQRQIGCLKRYLIKNRELERMIDFLSSTLVYIINTLNEMPQFTKEDL